VPQKHLGVVEAPQEDLDAPFNQFIILVIILVILTLSFYNNADLAQLGMYVIIFLFNDYWKIQLIDVSFFSCNKCYADVCVYS